MQGVLYYELLKPDRNCLYSQQLKQLNEQLLEKRPYLETKQKVILLYGQAPCCIDNPGDFKGTGKSYYIRHTLQMLPHQIAIYFVSLGGVIALLFSILILYFLPLLNPKNLTLPIPFNPLNQILFWIFISLLDPLISVLANFFLFPTSSSLSYFSHSFISFHAAHDFAILRKCGNSSMTLFNPRTKTSFIAVSVFCKMAKSR